MALNAQAEEFRSIPLEGSQLSSHMTSQMPFQVSSSQAFSRVLPEASYQPPPTVALPTILSTSQSSSQVLALDSESGIAQAEAQPQMLVELDKLGEYIDAS